LSQEEFPQLPDFSGSKEIVLDQKLVKDGLKKTFYAISTDG